MTKRTIKVYSDYKSPYAYLAKDLVYEAQLPMAARTDRIANEVLRLKPDGDTEVTWDEKKKKK